MIDLRQIRYFVATAEALSFSRAAERLNLSQPSLSRQVAALQIDLGVDLLERNSRTVRLTFAGERFLADARALLKSLDEACRNARMIDTGDLGELSIGFMMHAAHSSVPSLTRRFLAARPEVKLHLREVIPSTLVEGIANGEFDAGVLFSPGDVRGLSSAVIHREPLCLAVPERHPLDPNAIVTPDQLRAEPLIAAPKAVSPALFDAIADFIRRAGVEPAFRLETQLQQTILSLVAEGLGIALVPISLKKLQMPGVRFQSLADPPIVEQMVVWRTANPNPALPHFLEIARGSGFAAFDR